MKVEETLAYRCYLCLACILGTFHGDGLGAEGYYDDSGYFAEHLSELYCSDIDRVFYSQNVKGVYGNERWAFTDPGDGFLGHDLQARLFHDRDHDLYILMNRPTDTFDDRTNDFLTFIGAIPDQYHQAAQLVELVRPEYRSRFVLSGYSLGGGLSAYAAIRSSWKVRTIVFDPLGLNEQMMGARFTEAFHHQGVLSDRYRHMDSQVDWYYIAKSWVARLNVVRQLSSVGRVRELPPDPVRRRKTNSHDLRHVRFGLHKLWAE